jgi:hypothetical protein
MTTTKYTFDIMDFSNHKVASDRLTQEIQASAIVTALDHIDTTETECDVWFKLELSQTDDDILTALVAAHSGEPVPAAPIDPQGAPYVSLLLGMPGLQLCIKGTMFTVPPGQTVNDDLVFDKYREIQGSWLEVSGVQPGDFAEMFLVTPDGAEVLGQFGETVYLPPSGRLDQIVSEGTAGFPPGVKLRLSYTAVSAGTTRTIYGWHRMRK